MDRRQNRLRREWLYKRQAEAQAAATTNRKLAVKDAAHSAARAAKGKAKEDAQGEYCRDENVASRR
jgi:hypothetical protein